MSFLPKQYLSVAISRCLIDSVHFIAVNVTSRKVNFKHVRSVDLFTSLCATMNSGRKPQATDTTTTGSSQNQHDAAAPPQKKKQGMSALLQDVMNLQGSDCRIAGQKAKTAIQSLATSSAPRGNPTKGAKVRHTEVDSVTPEATSLCGLMKNDAVLSNVSKCLNEYIQSNCAYEVQKSMAVKIMLTAMTKWRCSICEAASQAADCTRFCATTVRKWAFSFFLSASVIPPEDITEEYITEELASHCGHHDNLTGTLLHNESFQLEARSFVRLHACIKGQPNLTCKMFANWVCTEYSTRIHEETDLRWLGELGFSRVHHQKGVYFDGHDRNDVVTYRNNFLTILHDLERKSISCEGTTPELTAGEKPFIRVVHDESTFYANCDQSYF